MPEIPNDEYVAHYQGYLYAFLENEITVQEFVAREATLQTGHLWDDLTDEEKAQALETVEAVFKKDMK